MRRLLLSVGVLAALSIASAARAQACKTPEGSGASVGYPTGNSQADINIAGLAANAMTPEKVARLPKQAGCTRGQLNVQGHAYVIGGENGDEFPRVALPADGKGPTGYVTSILPPNAPANLPPIFALAIVDTDGIVYAKRLYSAVPSDQRLQNDFGIALSGGAALVAYDAANKRIMRYAAPPAGGPNAPKTLSEPDGTVFQAVGNGDVKHAASGFICPAKVAGKSVERLTIYDASEGGRDVHCGYGTPNDRSWYTFYLTKVGSPSSKELFDAAVAEAHTQNGAGASNVTPPIPAGPAPAPEQAAFWADRAGLVQGVWLSKIGPWMVELRVTYRPGAEKEAAETAQVLYKAAYAQVH